MTLLYWIAAVVLSIIAASITSLVVTLMMNTLRSGMLDHSAEKFWNWCVNGLITISYMAIPFYTHADDSISIEIQSWGDFWFCLRRLSGIEAKWFICIAVFWFFVIVMAHRARSG